MKEAESLNTQVQATEEELRQDISLVFVNRLNSLGSAVYKQVTPPEVGELSPDSDFMGEVFVPDFENKRIYNNVLGKQFAVHVVSDRNKFNEVLEKGQKMADEWDDLVHQVLPDHPLSPKIEALVQTVASKPVRRSLEGFSEPYLAVKSPVSAGLEGLVADVGLVIDDDLPKKIQAADKKFPVFDCILEADDHLQTMINYWKEKEKGISGEREETYRETMYAQSVSLLNKTRQLSETTRYDRPEAERLQALGVTQNDPFQLSKWSARGSQHLLATMEAHRDGLENGWAIDDLSELASFNFLRQRGRDKYLHNGSLTFENFRVYNPPQYPSRECEEYFDKLDQLYQSFTKNPLKKPEDRTKALDQMKQAITEGSEKGYFSPEMKNSIKYFMAQDASARERSRGIEAGTERAVGTPLKEQSIVKASELGKDSFETKRSKVFKNESPEHKAVREAYENLNKIKKEIGMNLKPSVEDQVRLMDAIDRLDFTSQTYIQKKKGASTEAGKERLKGAEMINETAQKERRKFVDMINRGRRQDMHVSLNQFRREIAANQMAESLEKLRGVENMKTGISSQELSSRIADVLVHQFANSRNETTARVFRETGAAVLKDEIMNNKEFQKMTKSYQSGEASGEELYADLLNGECMKKIVSMKKKKEAVVEQKQKQIDAIKVKPKKLPSA